MKSKFLLILLVGLLILTTGKAANYYFNSGSGSDISVQSNWYPTYSAGTYSGTPLSGGFVSGNTYIINGTASVTISNAMTMSGTLQVGDGTNACTLTISSGTVYYSGSAINVSANATLSIANTTIPSLGTLAVGSTVNFSGSAAQTVAAGTYGNLTISNTGAVVSAGGEIKIDGTLTINNNATLNMLTYQLQGAITQATTTSGTDMSTTSYTINFSSAVNAGITTNMNVSGPNIPVGTTVTGIGTNSITISNYPNATVTSTAETLTFGFATSGTGTLETQYTSSTAIAPGSYSFTVEYNSSSSNQTFPNGVSAFTNLTIANSGYSTGMYGNITVSGVLNVANGATLSAGNYVLGGAYTTSGTGSLTTTCQTTTSATPITATTYTFGVTYSGTSGQTIVAANYSNLTSSSTGNRTLASSGNIGVSGTFTPGTNTYTITGSTVVFNGTSAQTIPAFSFANLSITNTSATVSAGAAFSVSTLLNIATNATLDMTSYQLTGGYSSSGTGTLKTACTANPAIPLGRTNSFNVNYYATTGGQYFGGTYNGGIVFNNTSGTNTAAANTFVAGTLAITNASSTVNMLTYSLQGSITQATTSSGNDMSTTSYTINFSSAVNASITTTMSVSGPNIPVGTTVTGIGTNSITISNYPTATVTSTAETLTFGFATSGAGTLETQYTGGSTAIPSGSYPFTVEYNGAANQTLPNGVSQFNNLIIANTGYSTSMYGNITLANGSNPGQLTISDGAIFNAGTYSIGGSFTTSNNSGSGTGKLMTANVSSTPLTSSVTYNYEVDYSGGGNQTIVPGNYTTLGANGYTTTTASTGTTNPIVVSFNSGITVGETVTGTYIPANTTVTAISSTSITLSNAPTAPTSTAIGTVTFVSSGTRTLASGTVAVSSSFVPGTTSTYTITSGNTLSLGYTTNPLPVLGANNPNLYNLTIAGGTATAPSSLTIGGSFTINSGATFKAPSGNFTVAGNWSNSGTFTNNSGTVILNGTSQTITGSNSFNNFTKSVGTAATLTFPSGQTQSFAGTLTLNGVAGQLLTIASSTGSSVATVNLTGTASVSYVTVSYNDNIGTTILATNGTDGGNNTGWTFTAGPVWTGAVSTNWNDAGNWNPAVVPSSTDAVTITKSGSNNLSIEISPTVASLSISAGNTVTLQNGQTLTLNGSLANAGTFTGNATSTVVIASSAAISGTGTTNFNNLTINSGQTLTGGVFGISGTFTISGTYTASGGTVTFNGTAAQTIPAATYANLSITNTSATVTAGGAIVIDNNLNIISGATLDMGTYQLTGYTFSQATSGAGAISSTSYTVNLSTSNANIAVGQEVVGFAIPVGTTVAAYTPGATSFTLSAYPTSTSTATNTLVFGFSTSGTGTLKTENTTSPAITSSRAWTFAVVYYNATGGQVIPSGTYNNGLTISNTSGTNTASGSVTINGNLALTNSGSNLIMGTNTLVSGGTFTTSGSGTLSTQVLNSSGALPAGVTWSFAVEFNGAGAQTFPNGTGTFNNLTIANTGYAAALYGNITVNGVLTVSSGATLTVGTYILGGSYSTSGTGTLTTACQTSNSATPIANTTYTFDVNYNGTNAQTICAANYNNLISSSTGGRTLSTSGDIYIAGTFTRGSNTYTISSSTVVFNGTASQTVPAGSYGGLSITNTSATVSAGGGLSVGGVLNIDPSATLDMTIYQLTGDYTTTGSGILKTSCTTNPAITAGRTNSFAVNYYATTGGQYFGGTYNNGVTFSNTSGTNTAAGNMIVSGTLAITNANSIVNMLTNTVSVSSGGTGVLSTSGSGTLETQYIYSGAIPAGITWAFTIEYNNAVASTTQTLPNGGGTFTSLIIDNSGGYVGLYGNISVTGTLSLTGGHLQLGSYNLTLANAPTGYSSASYIDASSSGVLTIQNVPSSGNTVFPIGTATGYAPLTFTGGTAGANISVGVAGTFTHAVPSPNNVVNLQWSILASSPTQPTVTFHYNGTDEGSGYSSTNAVLGTYSGGAYSESALGSVSGSNPYTTSVSFASGLPTTTASLYAIGDQYAFTATVPGAPTIGTAIDGDGQATVSFTAPSNVGGSGVSITGYTVTSNPGGKTSTGTTSPITVTGLTDGTAYTFTVTATNQVGTSAASAASNSVTPSSTTTWTGTSWTAGTPINSDAQSVIIAGNLANSSTFTHCNDLTINSGVTFATTNTIQVTGISFVDNGTISGGTIVLSGSSAQTISGSGIVGNITVSNSNGVTVGSGSNSLGISGLLTLQSGTFTTNGNVTLKSLSIANSGVFAPYQTSGNTGTISGNVTVERYIPAGYRAYRDLGAAGIYASGNTLYNTWQESGSYTHSGYGLFITGATSTAGSSYSSNHVDNGTGGTYLDYSLNSYPSASYWNTTNQSWSTVTNTNTTALNPFQSYRVLVRGDRGFDLYTTPIINYPNGLRMYDATTLRTTGSLIYGNVTYTPSGVANSVTGSAYTSSTYGLSSASNGYTYIANPYDCPIDFHNIFSNSRITNMIDGYWYLDPTIGATGSYVAYNAVANVTNTGYANGNLIQAGQGFLVANYNSTSPSLEITEADKVASSSKTYVFGAEAPTSKLFVGLLKESTRVDGVAVVFGNNFSNGLGLEDSRKLSSGTDNLAIKEGGNYLSIDGRLPATASDVLGIYIGQPSTTNYQLRIDASGYINNGYAPLLYDAYKNTTRAISGIDSVSFTLDTSITASYENRFSIIFTPSALAVNSIVASATLNDKVATITWNTEGEKGESYFEVEKSTDGKNFTAIGQQAAKNTSIASYTATDNSVVEGNNYYRIKAVSETGAVNYSNVAKVQLTENSNQFTVYPNPLVGKTLNVSLSNVNAGKYVVSIYNVLGEKVVEQAIVHEGNASHAITINNTLAAGIYSLVIREASSNQIVHQGNLSVQP